MFFPVKYIMVCGECGGIAPRVLDLGAIQTRLVSSTAWFFIPGEITQCCCWIGNWMDVRASLDHLQKIKISCPGRKSK